MKKLVIEDVDRDSNISEPMLKNVKCLDDLDSRLDDFVLSENTLSARASSALENSTQSLFSTRRGGLGTNSDRCYQTKREYDLSQAAKSARGR